MEKPFGEWNERDHLQGGDVTLVVNGKKVNEGKNGQLTKGASPSVRGREIHFKDIQIKSLK